MVHLEVITSDFKKKWEVNSAFRGDHFRLQQKNWEMNHDFRAEHSRLQEFAFERHSLINQAKKCGGLMNSFLFPL